MLQTSIKYLHTLQINTGEKIEYGCNQEHYREFWRRVAGCGPCVVSTLYGYHIWKGEEKSLSDWLKLMDDVWKDVTPTHRGLPTTKHLTERLDKFLSRVSPDFECVYLDIPIEEMARPDFSAVLAFILSSLARDEPVAFLVLDPGEEKKLDEWHWTVIVSLEQKENSAVITDYNSGEKLEADLKKWYETTRKGGGLVSIRKKER